MRIKLTSAAIGVGATLLALTSCGRSANRPAVDPDDVSVGYGTRGADDVTGAISSVSAAELGDARPLRIEELLRGKVAGLHIIHGPNGNYAFRIRGTPSLNGREQYALIVVDDVLIPEYGVGSALAGLVPEDIKRIDVLKDVASTSIYGMRGAGGVIVITTNRR
jgi:TonB-dependent SusC/RagA subfamily outer membrane receptor